MTHPRYCKRRRRRRRSGISDCFLSGQRWTKSSRKLLPQVSCLVGGLLGWWVAWLVGCLVAWLVGCLVAWLVGCLVGGLGRCVGGRAPVGLSQRFTCASLPRAFLIATVAITLPFPGRVGIKSTHDVVKDSRRLSSVAAYVLLALQTACSPCGRFFVWCSLPSPKKKKNFRFVHRSVVCWQVRKHNYFTANAARPEEACESTQKRQWRGCATVCCSHEGSHSRQQGPQVSKVQLITQHRECQQGPRQAAG